MARGVALIVVAVLIGVVLLKATDSPEPFRTAATDDASDDDTTVTTEDPDAPTTVPTTVTVARDPAEVTVLVANGAGIPGLATQIADVLKGQNYVTAEPGNTKEPADQSAVFYTPGYEADAAAIAALLTPPPTVAPLPNPPPVDDMKAAHVLVVAAADLAAASG